MLVDAGHPALEDAEIALDRVGMSIAAHVLSDPMLHGEVVFELSPDGTVVGRLIRHQHGLGLNLCLQNWL